MPSLQFDLPRGHQGLRERLAATADQRITAAVFDGTAARVTMFATSAGIGT
jgi:hypothetical protein